MHRRVFFVFCHHHPSRKRHEKDVSYSFFPFHSIFSRTSFHYLVVYIAFTKRKEDWYKMAKRKKNPHPERGGAGKGGVNPAVSQAPQQDETNLDAKENDDHVPRTSGKPETLQMPLRDTDSLFASRETIECVTKNHCVPCAYKIGLFDVALDKELCKEVPNQRPEQCPRLVASSKPATDDNDNEDMTSPDQVQNPMGYQPGMSVLTVGDGDFSFSLALARILFAGTNRPSVLVATSYESEETLRRVYPNFGETLEELHRLGVTTLYQVDATRLDQTLSQESASLPKSLFHRICWNFPCTAILMGQDGQNKEMEDNKQLVRSFVASATPFLAKDCGEIHLCHKTKPPFNQWKLEQVALESCIYGSPVAYAGRVVLDRALLLPYIPRKALDRKSFPCHDACFYIFHNNKSGSNGAPTTLQFESTLPLLQSDDKETGANSDDDGENKYPRPVTPALIASLRTRCLRQQAKRNAKKGSRYSHSKKRQKR
jgi:hypothetical protein